MHNKISKKDLQKWILYVNILAVGYPGVAQLVARLTGGQEAVSSSLATRTSGKCRKQVAYRKGVRLVFLMSVLKIHLFSTP